MYVLLIVVGIGILLAGQFTLSENFRLRGDAARAFGGLLLLYTLFAHEKLGFLLLHLFPELRMAGHVLPVPQIMELITAGTVGWALFQLTLRVFPEGQNATPNTTRRWASPAFWVAIGIFAAGVLGIRAYSHKVAAGLVRHDSTAPPPPEVPLKEVTPQVNHASAWIRSSPAIIKDVGIPMTLSVQRKFRRPFGIVLAISVKGPKGSGRCDVVYTDPAHRVPKAEPYLFLWYFNGVGSMIKENGQVTHVRNLQPRDTTGSAQ